MNINYKILRILKGHTSCPRCAARFHFILESKKKAASTQQEQTNSALSQRAPSLAKEPVQTVPKQQNHQPNIIAQKQATTKKQMSRKKVLHYRVPKYNVVSEYVHNKRKKTYKENAVSAPTYHMPKFTTQDSELLKKQQDTRTNTAKAETVANLQKARSVNQKDNFADVGTTSTAFRSTDEQNTQLPTTNLNTVEQAHHQHNTMEQADHLPFSLVNTQDNQLRTVSSEQELQQMPMHTIPQQHPEFNWMIASIAALVVFIVQLFYLILMLI
ncbi:MAG: hypothetical protein IJR46_07235 [Neisseriaceae bacterium]|nr:hypothetical protein [Neisseriaceae bacterium]